MIFKPNVAVLLFAQTAKSESGTKFFASNSKKNVELWKILNERIQNEIKKTKLDFFVFDENNQVGETFGIRITTAIQQVFDLGFEKVIVVGNDCLDLKAEQILDASKKLNDTFTILGPDNNGGTYLMGLSKANFSSKGFNSISWQTKQVFKELRLLFHKEDSIELPFLNDFNSNDYFKFHFKRLPFSAQIKKLLQVCLFSKIFNFNSISVYFSIYFNSILFNKGSPASAII